MRDSHEVFWRELSVGEYWAPWSINSTHIGRVFIREGRLEHILVEPFRVLFREGCMPTVEEVEFNRNDVAFAYGDESVVCCTDCLNRNLISFCN